MVKRKEKNNKSKEISSSIVSNLIDGESNINTKVGTAVGKQYTDNISNFNIDKDKFNDNKVKILAIVLILLIVIGIIIYFTVINNKTKNVTVEENKTIYDSAYTELNYKEDENQKKLICSKNVNDSKQYINEEETVIYYFENDKVVTNITHIYIKLNDKYVEYKDGIYAQYDKLLKNSYKYENVKTNIIKNNNELLVTIIVDLKRLSENDLNITKFSSYNEAKKMVIDSGYACK